jgi:formamidase
MPIKAAGEVPSHLAYLDSAKVAAPRYLSEGLWLATCDALLRIIDWMVANKGLMGRQAYAVAAAAMDLRIGQIVDVSNCIVAAIPPLDIFVN